MEWGWKEQEWVVQKLGNKSQLELILLGNAKSSTGTAICNHLLCLSLSPWWTKTGDEASGWSHCHYIWNFKEKAELKYFCPKNMRLITWARRAEACSSQNRTLSSQGLQASEWCRPKTSIIQQQCTFRKPRFRLALIDSGSRTEGSAQANLPWRWGASIEWQLNSPIALCCWLCVSWKQNEVMTVTAQQGKWSSVPLRAMELKAAFKWDLW